ncbi:DUF1499 domain-containing protein [Rubripirellula amarantea]|nr:DUF1499 domain-containing protein [Rubripirellula amarantea]
MKKRSITRRGCLIVLAIIATLGSMLLMLPFGGLKGLTTNVATLDPSASDPRLHPIDVSTPPSETAQAIAKWVESESLWKLESSDQGGDRVTMHLTRTTRVLRFVDDMHLELTPTATGTRISGKSKSRVGKGDLGQNARNLIELRRGLENLGIEGQ